jgi:hypothetical protein
MKASKESNLSILKGLMKAAVVMSLAKPKLTVNKKDLK